MTMSSKPDDGEDKHSQPSSTRVAVDVLQRDQRIILYDGDDTTSPAISPITDGFDTRRAAITWWQRACVRTFGHLDRVFPSKKLVGDGAVAAALYRDESGAGDDWLRQRLCEQVIDACQVAYRDLENQANEWLADGDGDVADIDPESQKHIAMRPAFSRLDDEQARTLNEVWGGFEGRSAVFRWAHRLPSVTNFDDSPIDNLRAELARDGFAVEMLTTESAVAQDWRERWAAIILLPAFATRAKRLQAGERAATTTEDNPWNEVRN